MLAKMKNICGELEMFFVLFVFLFFFKIYKLNKKMSRRFGLDVFNQQLKFEEIFEILLEIIRDTRDGRISIH